MDEVRDWIGPKPAIYLTTAVALLSVATGLVNVGAQSISGPLASFIPPAVQRTAGFTSALTGFLMLASAFGLRRRLRGAWFSTVVLLPVTAVQGLVQTNVASVPLIALSVLSLPTVLLSYGRFDRRIDLSTAQLAALVALIGTMAYGTIGTYALREEFGGVETLTDALYYTVVTASTVGYGDVIPASGDGARLFALSVVVLGTASFALALGSLIGPMIQARFAKALGTMTRSQLDQLENHVLVLGYGDLTEPILEELQSTVDFIVVTPDDDAATALGKRDINAIVGDPSDDEPLQRAGIDRARAVLVATNDDAQDALAILTASQLNPDARIVAAATDRENIEKLRRAGADSVISPAVIGGHLLVQSAMGGEGMEAIADRILAVEEEDDM
ncbi:NAD-binding protein [Halorhabdus amylolytica]|uniref:NAD-binding protein n=1 Tax=Halorhabdus amylolytica TaxID=2559573 RepID=UPI0010AAA3AE|nr:NAD-binding protein [Halorhabdus amylolytica]